VRVPKGFGKMLANPKLAWQYPVRPIGPSQRVEHWARGRMLGGSSSINGMVYNRGSAADYESIAALGNPGWGWDTILPIFRKIENHQLVANEMRGAGGPLDVTIDTEVPEPCNEVLQSATKLG
jgi:choline dehydrogenase-like flavoprotein